MLLLHGFALLLAAVVFVVVYVSVDCTTTIAVPVILTVMYLLWTNATTMIITIGSTLMKRNLFLHLAANIFPNIWAEPEQSPR